ncbi:MAG: 3'-5' exonuclease [Chitinophagaceae bacterium]|nr:MAG: 3'-5' exonuclease [Chitinophagaceae bacterium]
MNFAIVDIETTGYFTTENGITEVAIYVFDGEKIVENFETLINPEKYIPQRIQQFTGITNAMVAQAPTFNKVAATIHQLLCQNIFVAHNVNFDYSFLKSHLQSAGFSLETKKLCTVHLSRKIFKGLPSYSLGNLCSSLEININSRHRAAGDALATLEVFKKLMQNDSKNYIQQKLTSQK